MPFQSFLRNFNLQKQQIDGQKTLHVISVQIIISKSVNATTVQRTAAHAITVESSHKQMSSWPIMCESHIFIPALKQVLCFNVKVRKYLDPGQYLTNRRH